LSKFERKCINREHINYRANRVSTLHTDKVMIKNDISRKINAYNADIIQNIY